MFNVDSYIEENKDRMKFSYSKKNRKIDIELADSHSSLSIIKLYNSNSLISFIEDKITQDGNNFYHKVFGENLKESSLKETRSGSIRFLSFSNKVVFLFREVFEPVSWFYKPNETLPEPKKININKERTESDLFREKTVGKILFEKLAKSYPTYQVFSDEYKIPYFNVKNMLQKSKFEYNGKTEIRYKTFATKSVIKLLREEIHPDYWFMFPEELPQEDPAYKVISQYQGEEILTLLIEKSIENLIKKKEDTL